MYSYYFLNVLYINMELLEFAKNTAKAAGIILSDYFNKELIEQEKGFGDIVTEADKKAEEIIIKRIKENYPTHAILAEESGKMGKNDYVWVIDPLDGTTNFKHHIPYFNVSIALKYKEKTILGVVYNPVLDEMFYAQDKAYMNGKLIYPIQDIELHKMFIGVCHSSKKESIEKFVKATANYKFKVREIRRLGSSALEICYVASGRLAAFFGYDLKPWDYEAALYIAEKANCYIEKDQNNIMVYGSEKIKNKLI